MSSWFRFLHLYVLTLGKLFVNENSIDAVFQVRSNVSKKFIMVIEPHSSEWITPIAVAHTAHLPTVYVALLVFFPVIGTKECFAAVRTRIGGLLGGVSGAEVQSKFITSRENFAARLAWHFLDRHNGHFPIGIPRLG